MDVKYVAPTSFDTLPQGTVWKQLLDIDGLKVEALASGDTYEFYIQLSPDPNMPKWEKIGFLFAKIFEEYLDHEPLITELISIYNNNSTDFTKLVDILKLL